MELSTGKQVQYYDLIMIIKLLRIISLSWYSLTNRFPVMFSGKKAAVKIIKKDHFGAQRRNNTIENEVKILKRASFPCVVAMMVSK